MVQPHCGQVREEPPFDGRSQLIKFVSCFMCFYARLIFLPSADRLLRAHLSMDSIAQCHVLLLLTPVFSSKILIPPKEMVKKIFCLCSPLERAPATTPCWKERHGFYFSVFIWKYPPVPKACQIPSVVPPIRHMPFSLLFPGFPAPWACICSTLSGNTYPRCSNTV